MIKNFDRDHAIPALHRSNLTQLHLLEREPNYADKVIKGLAKCNSLDILLNMVLSMAGTEALSLRS